MKILSFGSLNIDHVYSLKDFPKRGETIHSKSYKKFVGGKGLNQSIAISKAGQNAYLAGKIGNDGDFLKEELIKQGVDVSSVSRSFDTPTGHAIIQVTENGSNNIILYNGANFEINKEDIDVALENFENGDYLVLQNEINNIGYIMKQAKEKGMNIVLNPSPMDVGVPDLPLNLVDIFILNEVEGNFLTNCQEPENIISAMRKNYSSAKIVLTLGAEGVAYSDENIYLQKKAVKVENVVDTTAAGDTFLGYFVAGLAENMPIEDILDRCQKACSICITKLGAAESIPMLKDLV